MATTDVWGPAEAEVMRLVRGAGVGSPTEVEAVPRSKVGDVRVDVGMLALPSIACAALLDLPVVESAAYVPPRIYVRTTLPCLEVAVLDSIETAGAAYGGLPTGSRDAVLVTYSDPNANKPLHVGHLRNLVLGSALAGLHRKRGYVVREEGSFGDWGVHMCQALLAYLEERPTTTPEDEGRRGDHFVGELYSRYHAGRDDEGDDGAARSLLVRLERGDPLVGTHRLLAEWAIAGITETYERVGVRFDRLYRETDHLDAARALIAQGLAKGQLTRRADGCVVFGDAASGRETVLVRPDGTLLVYAQILGIDTTRWTEGTHRVLSIFGHQWEAAAIAYRDIAEGLGETWARRYEPVFYGMVRLPEGSMRSRLGRSVTADEAIDQLADSLGEQLAVAALKYHLLRTARSKSLVYDPTAISERTLPVLRRVLAYAGRQPVGGERREPSSTREAAALRRLLLALSGFGGALDVAIARRDPSVALQYLEHATRTADQLPAGLWSPRLRAAMAVVAEQCLTSLGIHPPVAT